MDVVIRPERGAWEAALGGGRVLTGEQKGFREQLGIAPDGPVVMGGHQAQVWHPGILAKLLAMGAAGRAMGARAAWVVVDQDEMDPWVVRYPVRRGDGTLEVRTWRMDGSAKGTEGHVPGVNLNVATGDVVGANTPRLTMGKGERSGAAGVEGGLARIAAAVARHAGEASAAMQVGRATVELGREVMGDAGTDVAVFGATALSRTEVFARVVETMRSDPARMAASYNAAVRRHPEGRIAVLGAGEAPLWHVAARAGSPRRRVTVEMLASTPVRELAPRALLMTGLLRWAGCDLFVHGTGGAGGAESAGAGGYDAITTEWFREWLGAELAPTALATATVRLNFTEAQDIVTPEEIARARWLAHAARHRPALLADLPGQAASGTAVATLKRLKHRRDPESRLVKHEAFRTLHGVLDEVRARHAGELRELETAAASAAARRAEAEIIADRTWAFPLYEAGQMRELARAVDGVIAGG